VAVRGVAVRGVSRLRLVVMVSELRVPAAAEPALVAGSVSTRLLSILVLHKRVELREGLSAPGAVVVASARLPSPASGVAILEHALEGSELRVYGSGFKV